MRQLLVETGRRRRDPLSRRGRDLTSTHTAEGVPPTFRPVHTSPPLYVHDFVVGQVPVVSRSQVDRGKGGQECCVQRPVGREDS